MPFKRSSALRSRIGEVGHNICMHYVYILEDATDKLYFGYSSDLRQRIEDHIRGKVTTTKIYNEPRLIWYCAFTNKKKALDFERYLKAGSGHAFAKKHLV